jgi:hypothetical protein
VEITPHSKDVENFNKQWASGGHVAPVVDNSIMFGSLSCGHNNMGLRAIAAQMPTESVLLGRSGKCDVEHLRERDPDYAEAVINGLKWLVLKAEVRTKYPEVLLIIQVVVSVFVLATLGSGRGGATVRTHWLVLFVSVEGGAGGGLGERNVRRHPLPNCSRTADATCMRYVMKHVVSAGARSRSRRRGVVISSFAVFL